MEETHVVGAAILNRGTCLVAQRGKQMSLPLKWEFPGGKVKRGENPTEALRRELAEEYGVKIQVFEFIKQGTSKVRDRTICLDVYRAEILSGELKPVEHQQLRWVTAIELEDLDWAEADIPVMTEVQARLLASPKATG